jgi:hypothetical protein
MWKMRKNAEKCQKNAENVDRNSPLQIPLEAIGGFFPLQNKDKAEHYLLVTEHLTTFNLKKCLSHIPESHEKNK